MGRPPPSATWLAGFAALSYVFSLTAAVSRPFSVLDDVLAYPQYEIDFSDQPPFDSKSSLSKEPEIGWHQTKKPVFSSSNVTTPIRNRELMVLHGKFFLCDIPAINSINQTDLASIANATPEEEKKSLSRAASKGWELLKGMEGNCIYLIAGWWSYSFCFNDSVRQFHHLPSGKITRIYPPTEDLTVESYVLGSYSSLMKTKKKHYRSQELSSEKIQDQTKSHDTSLSRMETRGETRYLVQNLGGGTICDLTGKERTIEVQFHCHPHPVDRIGLIKEISTCAYLMVIYTPRLCNDVAFLPIQRQKSNLIECHPMSTRTNPQIHSISNPENVEEVPSKGEEGQVIGTPDRKPQATIVGGIEIGAKKVVGNRGRLIPKSSIVGGGKSKYLNTPGWPIAFEWNERQNGNLRGDDN